MPIEIIQYSVYLKKSLKYYLQLVEIAIIIKLCKSCIFDHHTSTYTYCLSHILKKRSEKIKILMTAFMSNNSASGNKRWSFDEIFYGLITIFPILFLGKIKRENCWCVFKEKFHN